MRYKLDFRESVREYLRSLTLTRECRVKLNATLIELTAEVSDSFRFDPANRPDPSSLLPLYLHLQG